MANGRGALECCYCKHYRCHNLKWFGYDAVHEAGECRRFHVRLPDTTTEALRANRVCSQFVPNKCYRRDSTVTAHKRFADFPVPLLPGILYGYHYNDPPDAKPIAALAPEEGRTDP